MPATSKPGPKSARAKAAVSRNAIAHGVLANVPVLPGVEDEDEWRAYRAGIFESLAPDGHFECALAERAARLFWRLRRVERYETEMAALSQQRAGHDARLLTPPPASAPAPAATPAPTGALPAGPDDDAHTTDATPDNPAIARRAQELRVERLAAPRPSPASTSPLPWPTSPRSPRLIPASAASRRSSRRPLLPHTQFCETIPPSQI